MNLNQITLIGRAGRDPEVRYTQNGVPIMNFSMATARKWKDKQSGEWQEKTTWHNVVVFGKYAEHLNGKFGKGTALAVVGSYESEQWTDKNGETKYGMKVYAEKVQVLERRNAQNQTQGDANGDLDRDNAGAGSGAFTEDDIPF